MSYYWLHHDISSREVKRWLSSVQRLSWFHYAFAAFIAYLVFWLDASLVSFYSMLRVGIIINRYHQDNSLGLVPLLLMTAVIGAVNFLILWPFLRFPIRRRIVYVCLCVGWMIIFWNLQADTR